MFLTIENIKSKIHIWLEKKNLKWKWLYNSIYIYINGIIDSDDSKNNYNKTREIIIIMKLI